MNQTQFQKAAGISAGLAARWFPHITAAMKEFGITAPLDQAMFIAQMGHESGGFTRLVENLNYAADSLVPTFGKHRITAQQAAALGRTATQPANQRAIANLVYGGEWGKKNLGNQVAGDGWKYRGRGLKQVTGLSNYRSCGLALKLELVTMEKTCEPAVIPSKKTTFAPPFFRPSCTARAKPSPYCCLSCTTAIRCGFTLSRMYFAAVGP